MKSTPKKVAQQTTRSPNEDPDPLGVGTTLAEMIAALKDAYHARLYAFLRVFLLVRLAPAVLRGILDAATTQGGPVSFDLRITVYPRNAAGFFRVIGALNPSSDDFWDAYQPDAPSPGAYIETLFGKRVPVSQFKTKRRRFGRRRLRRPLLERAKTGAEGRAGPRRIVMAGR